MNDEPTVLAVDDEENVADSYKMWLDEYDVRVAYGGEAALDAIDDDIDVVLLDRMMPNLSGDEVLARVRETGYEVRVAMVTAAEPDVDIIDMPFDEYLTKPVDGPDLRGVVERLAALSEYDETVRDTYARASKVATLESELGTAELADNEEYAALRDSLEDTDAPPDGLLDDPDLFRAMLDGPGTEE